MQYLTLGIISYAGMRRLYGEPLNDIPYSDYISKYSQRF